MRRRFGFPNSANDTPELLEFFRVLKEDGFLNADKPFSMKVMAYDEYQSEEGRRIGEYVPLDRRLKESDVISLHCPLLPSTLGIISNENIAKMKGGVIIINTSREPLVVEKDSWKTN